MNNPSKQRDAILRLYREAFGSLDGNEWVRWYFDTVYTDHEGFVLEAGNPPVAVSALMMHDYTMLWHGRHVPIGYIAGACTTRDARGQGNMKRLMDKALQAAYERGHVFSTLIPANDHLYFFYDKFGYSTVFFVDEQRYTSAHVFARVEGYEAVEPTYPAFAHLEGLLDGAVQHTEVQYADILDDLDHDHGEVFAVAHSETGETRAMAFAVERHGVAEVRALLGTDPDAQETVLAEVSAHWPDKSVAVWAPAPEGTPPGLRSRGMARIVNVQAMLDVLALSDPKIHQTVRVRDHVIKANNGIFVIADGSCRRLDDDAEAPKHLDLDVTVNVLASIIFNTPKMGQIFGFDTARPHFALMLDT